MRVTVLALIILAVLAPAASARPLDAPIARAASTCADYPNQAAAQRAADTRDGDGDGLYCEALPCPCLKPGATPKPPSSNATERRCTRPSAVQSISFSATKYPNFKRHTDQALRRGWPRTLILNRPGADARRNRLLSGWDTRPGYDRDEYPPAIGRGKGKGLVRGNDPRGWMADVAYVPGSENRSQGSTLGLKLRRFCDGTKFRYVFY